MIKHSWALIIVALCVASVTWAQVPAQQDGKVIPQELLQKQSFVKGLVEDQPVSNRILSSQHKEAIRLLELARERYSKALAAIAASDFGRADSQFNEAISAIGKARNLVPDTEGIIAQQRSEFEKTLDAVESLQKSYLSFLKRVNLRPEVTGAESKSRVTYSINKYLESAKSYAKAGQWSSALKEMRTADSEMKNEMGRILGLMAVEYNKKFVTLAEEFTYETERNRNLLDLISVAVSELQPAEDIRLTIEDLIEQNSAVMDLAKEYAKLRDYSKALINVRAGIVYLEVALTSAGLIMPQASEAK